MTATLPGTVSPDVADRADRRLGGDEAVLADIYQRHGSVVFNLAMRVTRDRSAAEEVTQAVFLDVWRRPERFDPTRGSLRSWLAMLAHHRSVDWVREEAARRRRELRCFETRVAHLPDLEDTVAATLGAERVRCALSDLCETERTAIGLAYFGGRTYRQVAQELGVPEGTVKSRIRTGLAHLATALRSETVNPSF